MLLKLFYDYQTDLTNDSKFTNLIEYLKPKIMSILRGIDCEYYYREDFIQECYLKVIRIAMNKKFDLGINVYALDRYFELAFKTVKQEFIRKYKINQKFIFLDEVDENGVMLIDTLMCNKPSEDYDITEVVLEIKALLTEYEARILDLLFNYDGDKIRSLTDVALVLNVTPQAIHKRFTCIKNKIKNHFVV